LVLETIQWALHPATALPQDVSVDHGGGNVIVAQKFLDGSDVGPPVERMSCKAVAEGMA
jgi:hypothetical protein